MKTGTIIGIVLLAAASVAGAVWIFKGPTPDVVVQGSGTSADPATATAKPKAPVVDKAKEDHECPPLPEAGQPLPEVSVDATEFDFGTMEALQKKSHVFVVRNKGKGDLLIKQGKTTCKCTMSEMAEKPIPPGGSAEVTLTWEPIARMDDWSQNAEICTNDAKRRKITFVVKGDVVARVSLIPGEMWNFGEIIEGKPSVVHGRLYSMTLDKFTIKKITFPETSLVKGTWAPLSEEDMKTYKAKSGYIIRMETQPGIPAGSFVYKAEIQTDIPEDLVGGGNGPPLTMKVQVGGTRSGPFMFVPGNGTTGATFRGDKQVAAMGRIEKIKGKRGTLVMFVRNCPAEGLKILDQKCEDCKQKPLKITLEEDKAWKEKSKRYFVHIDYPPGPDNNPHDDLGNTGCRMHLQTNHPDAKNFDLMVFYQGY